jgi:DNA modification methylase
MIAAIQTGRAARLIEKDPRYVDATIRRVRAQTGIEAIHCETGKTFAEIEAERLSVGVNHR